MLEKVLVIYNEVKKNIYKVDENDIHSLKSRLLSEVLTNTDKYSVNKKQLENLSFLNSEFKNCHSTFVLKTPNLNIENCKVYIEDVLSNVYGINKSWKNKENA